MKEEIEKRISEHILTVQEKKYYPIYVALAGSQNYNLDYKNSDVDTKAIVLPTFEDIVFNKKMVSTTYIMENNEHCDLKDIRLMFNNFKKQNINFLEILFTPYFWIDDRFSEEISQMRAKAEDIARWNPIIAIKCMAGMAMEKYKAMEHLYPTIKDKIEKYGYDPKQLHHIVRMREFLERYMDGESFQNCLNSEHKEYLMKIKMGDFPLELARCIAIAEMEKIDSLREKANFIFEDKESVRVTEEVNKILLKVFEKQFNRK